MFLETGTVIVAVIGGMGLLISGTVAAILSYFWIREWIAILNRNAGS